MQVTAQKFHRHSSSYLRLIRSGKVREMRVTWHGIPGVRIESVYEPKIRRAKKK